jgi:D-alanine-D-alanine ligase
VSDGKVLVLYNEPDARAAAGGGWQESDAGVLNAVRAVSEALQASGVPHRVAGIRKLADLEATLQAGAEDTVFNLVERLDGLPTDFNRVPDACRALGRACTGSGSQALDLTFDKQWTKQALRRNGVTVPDAWLCRPGTDDLPEPQGAVIVKPLHADGSEGIGVDSVLTEPDAARLRRAVERIHAAFGQPALVERYIEGRELNVSLFERNGTVSVLPISEIDFSLYPAGRPHIVDYAVKWLPGTLPGIVSPRKVPAPLPPAVAAAAGEMALRAWHACGCNDYVRIDTRLASDGGLFVLEVNANPDLSPLAGFPASLRAAGIGFAEFVRALVAKARPRARPGVTPGFATSVR